MLPISTLIYHLAQRPRGSGREFKILFIKSQENSQQKVMVNDKGSTKAKRPLVLCWLYSSSYYENTTEFTINQIKSTFEQGIDIAKVMQTMLLWTKQHANQHCIRVMLHICSKEKQAI